MKTVVGCDLSLTKTGLIILQEDGKVLLQGLVKSKPGGDKPVDETRRMMKIVEEIFFMADASLGDKEPDLVVIEGLAFLATGTSLTQLSFLHHVTRAICETLDWKFVICFPTTLKKFATGSGKGDKDMISLAVYKNYGYEAPDNNLADAYTLAAAGMALLGSPLKALFTPQQEVIQLLKKQL